MALSCRHIISLRIGKRLISISVYVNKLIGWSRHNYRLMSRLGLSSYTHFPLYNSDKKEEPL